MSEEKVQRDPGADQNNFREQFDTLIQSEEWEQLSNFLDDQNISDVAQLIDEDPDHETLIVSSMSVHRAASVFKILELSKQKKIIHELPPHKTAALLNELPPDDRTDFLEELPSNVVRELIKLLNAEERKVALSLLGYPENSVGRLMTPDYVYVYENNTVAEVLETIRRKGKDSETINVIYVINAGSRTISRVDLTTFAVTGEKAISTPSTYNPANPLYLAANNSGTIYFTDGAKLSK